MLDDTIMVRFLLILCYKSVDTMHKWLYHWACQFN